MNTKGFLFFAPCGGLCVRLFLFFAGLLMVVAFAFGGQESQQNRGSSGPVWSSMAHPTTPFAIPGKSIFGM